jgi:hypothetical protein
MSRRRHSEIENLGSYTSYNSHKKRKLSGRDKKNLQQLKLFYDTEAHNVLDLLNAILSVVIHRCVSELSLITCLILIYSTIGSPLEHSVLWTHRKGLSGKQAAWASKKYRGHRVLPESILQDLAKAGMN